MRVVGLVANRRFGERESMVDVMSADQSGFGAHGERRPANANLQRLAHVATRAPIVAQRLRRHA